MKKQVTQFTKSYDYVAIYDSLTEAERVTGINKANICNCLKDRYKSAGGYVWTYTDLTVLKYPSSINFKN